jgi:PAS domain S-box-containing protein
MDFLRRLNLQTKIALVTYLMILLVLAAGAGAINRVILPSIEADLQAESWRIVRGVQNQLDGLTEESTLASFQAQLSPVFDVRPKLLYVEIFNIQGRQIFWMGNEGFRSHSERSPPSPAEAGTLTIMNLSPEGLLYQIIAVGGKEADGARPWLLRVGINAASLPQSSHQLFRLLFIVTLVILGVSFFLIRWFTAMITEPVNQLLHMTRMLARGKLEVIPSPAEGFSCLDQSRGISLCGTAATEPYCPNCPLFSETDLENKPEEEATGLIPPRLSCANCRLAEQRGKDELSQLLFTFHCMSAGIRIYQEKLRRRYEFEERLLEACPDGIMANDLTGSIILYNTGAERLLGYRADEVLNKLPVANIYPPGEPQRVMEALQSSAYGGPGILLDYTTQIIRQDGHSVPIRLSATLVPHGGEDFAVVGYFHDLTELTQHMTALEELNERLDASNKDLARLNRHYLEMLSFVTHELKTPIANAFMSANALRQDIFGPLNPEQTPMIHAICRNLTQSIEMIRHYLDLSRIEKDELPIQPQRTALLAEVIEPVLADFTDLIKKQGVDLQVDVPAAIEWSLDPELFRGVFTNLVSNALKYGETGGTIRISAQIVADRLRMEVWNSGPGIGPEDNHKLFHKFQRLQPTRTPLTKGTGLGLFITKAVVERHGGSIKATSEPGQWVSFSIELPLT